MAGGRRSVSRHVHPNKLRGVILRAAERIGYREGVNFHALRFICNNRIRVAGLRDAIDRSAAGARGILGHASEQAARPYINANIDYLRPMIEAYDRWLDEMAATAANPSDIQERK